MPDGTSTAPGAGRETARMLARRIGAVQEARRLGDAETGTEHLLLTAYAEPQIRRMMAELGADLTAVQARVGRSAAAYATREPPLTAEAVRVLEETVVEVDADPDMGPRIRGGGHGGLPDPLSRSWLLRRLLARMLTDTHPHRARSLIDDLGLTRGAHHIARQLLALDVDEPVPRAPFPAQPPSTPARDHPSLP